MSKTRDDTKKYAQLHGIVSEMHQLEVRYTKCLKRGTLRTRMIIGD